MATEYSAEHCAAYRRWQASGSAGISEADVALIESGDRATGCFIRQERADTLQRDVARMKAQHAKAAPPAAPAAATLTHAHVEAMLKGTIQAIAQRLKELSTRIAALEGGSATADTSLEARVKALEDRPQWVYKGTWEQGAYVPGNLVTDRGSLWYCRHVTGARPGEPAVESRSWVLVAKRGSDGKDLRV